MRGLKLVSLRRPSLALLLILALALVARVGVIVATPDFAPLNDSREYDRHALWIAHNQSYPGAFWPPLYPVLLAGVYALGGGWTAGRLLGALLGVAAVALIFVISERLWSRRVAIVSGAIAAVFPPLVLYSASLRTEPLFLLLVLATLLATLEYRRDERLRWAIAAGISAGSPRSLEPTASSWSWRRASACGRCVPGSAVRLSCRPGPRGTRHGHAVGGPQYDRP
jgi:4-amino-4-deoxy-L-arabinose transferase-like glycosyltransferase